MDVKLPHVLGALVLAIAANLVAIYLSNNVQKVRQLVQ
jgi:hypothetical protein